MPPRKRRQKNPFYSNTRHCWTKGDCIEADVYVYDDDEMKYSKEVGPEINLFIKNNYVNAKLVLTDLIGDELDALQIVIEEAFALARETVYQRDEVARDIFDQTGEPLTRLYRRSPILVHRTGTFREYGQSLLDRLKSLRELAVTPTTARNIREAFPIFPPPGISGEVRPELAERNAEDSQPEHDPEKTGEFTGVRQVLRNGDSDQLQGSDSGQADATPDPGRDNGSDEHAEDLPDTRGEGAGSLDRSGGSQDFGGIRNSGI